MPAEQVKPKRHCVICGEDYDPEVDQYHVENCRDTQKP